jgi:hypothetical protein
MIVRSISYGNDCPTPTSYNRPFFETVHNCELRKNDFPERWSDPDLCKNATEYTNNHEYKDATEITLYFINIKKLKFVYRHNRNKLARALVAYL